MASMLKNKYITMFVFVFCMMINNANAQQVIIFEDFVNDYEGILGTVFQTDDPFAYHVFNPEWGWDGEDGEGVHYFVIKFENIIGNTSGLIPPNSEVISAVLSLYITDPGDSATVYNLLTPFDENSDLNTFNGGVAPRPGVDYDPNRVTITPEPSVTGAYLEIDLTSSVQNVVNGGDNLGWLFVPNGTGGVNFNSNWGDSNPPNLRVIIEGDPTTQGSRTISHNAVNVGDVIDVEINLNLASGTEDVTVVETVAAGWNASEISDGGVLDNGVITWQLNQFSGSQTLRYKAEATTQTSVAPIFEGTINDFFTIAGESTLQVYVPLYPTGNVLAVGVWDDSTSSSDLVVTAELSDNEGNVYVRDSGHPDGWPQGTVFRWQVAWDGLDGAEEPGWQQREFDDSSWIEQTDVGFTVGRGSGTYEVGETPLDDFARTVYTRSVFDLPNAESIYQMTLKLEGDDSAVAWLNGMYIGVAGSNIGDDGENPWEYRFDSTSGGGSDVSGEESTDFIPGEIFTIQIQPRPSTIERMMPEPAYVDGETIAGIQVSVSVPEGESPDLTITETPPTGWSIANITSTQGQAALEDGSIVWSVSQATGNPVLSYDLTPAPGAESGEWSGSGTDGTFNIQTDGQSSMEPYVDTIPLYREGNVLAVGVWNAGFGSSDMAATAELYDSNLNVYVRDTGESEGWPQNTIFRWKVVYFDDGSGAEEPGWLERDFDDSGWTEYTNLGFTIGHGSGAENGEVQLSSTDETVYTRSVFDAIDYDSIKWLTFKIEADDTGIGWLNGHYLTFDGGSDSEGGETVPDFYFDTISSGGNEVTNEPAATYQTGATAHFLVDLVESTSVTEWSVY